MKEEINYSIIIPHKNIPDLLQRCLNSIPRREDIQIIVVDDNSDSNIVDFEHFPGMSEPCVEVVFTKEGKGAGYARNVGLSKAKGIWLLFADADDFYNDCLLEAIDTYKYSEFDLIFFNADSVYSNNQSQHISHPHADGLNFFISKYTSAPVFCMDSLRFYFGPPWCKMIKAKLIKNNSIYFDEVSVHNDTMFSLKIGFLSKKQYVSKYSIYTTTLRKDSITFQKDTKKRLLIKTYVSISYDNYMRKIIKKRSFRLANRLFSYIRNKEYFSFIFVMEYLRRKKCSILLYTIVCFPMITLYRILRFVFGKIGISSHRQDIRR
ncbi:PGL/p-HBAD biosynthesis glycosyltransferase [termite gut metagenome]|uniref:PGL/p-HBAD biosynthesis glycosyltransferase n=1 Tax=termite gut metagenome TaxID=433724 RepID=A0A5J4QLV9_9ZZZZ